MGILCVESIGDGGEIIVLGGWSNVGRGGAEVPVDELAVPCRWVSSESVMLNEVRQKDNVPGTKLIGCLDDD